MPGLRPCLEFGCPALVKIGRCDKHGGSNSRATGPLRALYGTAAWRTLRLRILAESPLCLECQAGGRDIPATDVDHIEPARVRDAVSFFDRSNLQPLCKAHHSRKTARGA